MSKSPEDQARRARENVRDGKYIPPHGGAFGLRSTIVGRGYSDKEKADRAAYEHAHKAEKKRRGKK